MYNGTTTLNVSLKTVKKHESFIPLMISSSYMVYRGMETYSYLLALTNLSTSCSAGVGITQRLFVAVLP